MKQFTIFYRNLDPQKLANKINKLRLETKNQWFQINIEYEHISLKLKIYDTWVQYMTIQKDNNYPIKLGGSKMDQKVSEFKEFIQYVANNYLSFL